MVIDVTVPDRRQACKKQFGDAYPVMLVDLDTALAPSGLAFNDEQRAPLLRWKKAAIQPPSCAGQLAPSSSWCFAVGLACNTA